MKARYLKQIATTLSVATTLLFCPTAASAATDMFLKLGDINVSISSYATGGSGGEDRLTENISLHFLRMEGTYRQQQPDGSLGPPIVWVVAGSRCR